MTKKTETKKQDVLVEPEAPGSLSEAGNRAWADGDRSSKAAVDSKHDNVEDTGGPGTDLSDQSVDPVDVDEHPKMLDHRKIEVRLGQMVNELVAMQHARAAAGGGHSTHWQNAQRHIREAIADIEQQTATDSRR
jgi:hypothetical protein